VREMGWACCDVIHLLWLQGLSEAAIREGVGSVTVA
jgi:hypothetical protein